MHEPFVRPRHHDFMRAHRPGPHIDPDSITFRIWAPGAKSVDVLADGVHEMERSNDGWFVRRVFGASIGTKYKFRIDDQVDVPDPASRFQPDDVGGASEVIGSSYEWQASDWKGRPWNEAVFLEIHVGTFSNGGTFNSAIEKLDHVAGAGFTAIELMPIADFAGRWNWGYDGALLYAPDSSYGRPNDLKALIDAAHMRGLMVFLDVVYNHFGPEGNYLPRYASQFFGEVDTSWGKAIDYEKIEVREFAIENALYWLQEFRFDGLRLDAVHAIPEPGRSIFLKELSQAAGRLATASDRHIHLVLENDLNQASLVDPMTDPPRGKFRAQWNDDLHHVLHVLLTGETGGYYGDYRKPENQLVRALSEGFVYQGEPSPHRDGRPRGESTSVLPASSFVNFLQNHDQIGNRAKGERLAALARPAALEAALAIILLAPGAPLLFMGDEWGAREPFPFFCDFKGDLADAVRKGRRAEFADSYAIDQDGIPDPLAETTLRSATLDWSVLEQPEHRARLHLVRQLLAARKEFIAPRLPDLRAGHGQGNFVEGVLTVRWLFCTGEALALFANLTDETRPRPISSGRPIWGGNPPAEMPPWSVYAAIEAE